MDGRADTPHRTRSSPADPRVAKVENADRKDANPPAQLVEKEIARIAKEKWADPGAGKSVVYWMRMNDLRRELAYSLSPPACGRTLADHPPTHSPWHATVTDNHVLSLASAHAQKHSLPLLILVTLTPSEYKAHDRSPRRIDFLLRNLRTLSSHSSSKLNIPLFVHSMPFDAKRKSVPKEVIRLCKERFESASVWANLSYEVDELERDLGLVKEGAKEGVRVELRHDRLVIEPGGVKKKTGGEGMYNVSHSQSQLSSTLRARPYTVKLICLIPGVIRFRSSHRSTTCGHRCSPLSRND